MDIENMNIEKATERCKALTNPEKSCWIGISNQKAIETVLSELEKKDKVINEMAYAFWNYDICDYEITDDTYRKCEYIADDEEPPCKECIKEYFTNKVEREGK